MTGWSGCLTGDGTPALLSNFFYVPAYTGMVTLAHHNAVKWKRLLRLEATGSVLRTREIGASETMYGALYPLGVPSSLPSPSLSPPWLSQQPFLTVVPNPLPVCLQLESWSPEQDVVPFTLPDIISLDSAFLGVFRSLYLQIAM